MKTKAISTKIKFIGILFIILMISIVAITMYLNNNNKKDALVINIAGKQRMLTQKISKNIFYLYYNNKASYDELNQASIEFIYNLNSLKNGNSLTGVFKAPTYEIAKQISKIEILWNNFYTNIQEFKKFNIEQNSSNKVLLGNIVEEIQKTNIPLLEEMDKAVSMYTIYSETKTDFIKKIQYIFAFSILLLIIYSFMVLKSMEDNAKRFFEESKKIFKNSDEETHLKPMKIEAEKEIVEATDTINCFIDKINSAMDYSAVAMEQSKNASIKLEEITDEFDKVIGEVKNSADVSKQLDISEDMVIETQEELINSTKKLQELKKELDKLLNNCKMH